MRRARRARPSRVNRPKTTIPAPARTDAAGPNCSSGPSRWTCCGAYGVVATIAHNSALAALVPHPREHQWTYFGILAPASPLRDAVVPRRTVPSPGPGIGEAEADPCAKAQRQSWAELLQRTFAVDVLRCPTCGGRRHRVATLTDPLVARRILKHLRLRAEPPPLAPARPEPQLRFA